MTSYTNLVEMVSKSKSKKPLFNEILKKGNKIYPNREFGPWHVKDDADFENFLKCKLDQDLLEEIKTKNNTTLLTNNFHRDLIKPCTALFQNWMKYFLYMDKIIANEWYPFTCFRLENEKSLTSKILIDFFKLEKVKMNKLNDTDMYKHVKFLLLTFKSIDGRVKKMSIECSLPKVYTLPSLKILFFVAFSDLAKFTTEEDLLEEKRFKTI